MKENEKIATEFAKKYNGKIVGVIHGNKILKSGEKSRAGYKVDIDGNKIHIYLIRTWHNIREGISISTEQLQEALDENALILMSYFGAENVCHSIMWEEDARAKGSYDIHSRYGTKEVFQDQGRFRILNLDKYKIEQYYPVDTNKD